MNQQESSQSSNLEQLSLRDGPAPFDRGDSHGTINAIETAPVGRTGGSEKGLQSEILRRDRCPGTQNKNDGRVEGAEYSLANLLTPGICNCPSLCLLVSFSVCSLQVS